MYRGACLWSLECARAVHVEWARGFLELSSWKFCVSWASGLPVIYAAACRSCCSHSEGCLLVRTDPTAELVECQGLAYLASFKAGPKQ